MEASAALLDVKDALSKMEARHQEETKRLEKEIVALKEHIASLEYPSTAHTDKKVEASHGTDQPSESSHSDSKQEIPNPNEAFPVPSIGGVVRTVFLKNIINNPNIIVGDYTYYDDPDDVHNFEKNVLYFFDHVKDRLIIGKFCQLASGIRFLMNAANHDMDGFSTYPFKAFGGAWGGASLNAPFRGDTVVGNDVWIGNSATILPGVTIGDGAIIGTNALVTKNVEPYSIVGGNPAKVIRKRFDEETIQFLLELKWWDWPVEKITRNLKALTAGDMAALQEAE